MTPHERSCLRELLRHYARPAFGRLGPMPIELARIAEAWDADVAEREQAIAMVRALVQNTSSTTQAGMATIAGACALLGRLGGLAPGPGRQARGLEQPGAEASQ